MAIQKAGKRVLKTTRCSREGRMIHCPKCDMPTVVYHLTFSSLTCWKCKGDIRKYDWFLETNVTRIKNNKNLEKC